MTPIALLMERVCTKDYTLSNGVEIEKDTKIQIPVIGYQNDPRHWPEPEIFCPERHTKEKRTRYNSQYIYLPFGAGPRNCIGMRFALMEMKVSLFHLLKSFTLEPSSKTPVPIKFDRASMMPLIDGGNNLKLVSRDDV